ncbi:MAG: hypothetical protein P4L84_38030 [Isosphaeraceae bacterium]|nr:hypothetical protein [Isosphaeraceae bacterium]
MAAGQLGVTSWLLRLITWDGVLPACIVFAPAGIELLFPNNRGAIELAAVLLPITAFWVRFSVGKRHIDTNHCGPAVRTFQLCVFCFGIFVLVFFDAAITLSHIMPQGALFSTSADILVWGIIGAIYVTSMAIAMYPGRSAKHDEEFWQDGG